jgi:carboxypeptidase T
MITSPIARTIILLALITSIVFLIGGRPFLLQATPEQNQTGLPTPPFVLRVYYHSIRDIERLQEFDLWEYNNLKEGYVLVSADNLIYDRLNGEGWRIEIDPKATSQLQQMSRKTSLFQEGYRTVDELYEDLTTANEQYPDMTELVAYGHSYCQSVSGCTTPGGDIQPGYDLLAIRVTNERISGHSDIQPSGISQGTKPVFFLMANIHAREITTPELAMRFLDWLLEGYSVDADRTWLIDWHEIWIVPTANPDGHWLVTLGTNEHYGGAPFTQRKNANRDVDSNGIADCQQWPPASFAQYGIDLNRNHSFGWGLPGSSSEPCSLLYRGPTEASELEVAYLEELIRVLIPDQRGPELTDAAPKETTGMFITLHSYSNLILWPWGFLYVDAPNKSDLKAIGDRLALFNRYLSCQPTECLYAANGTSDDWAYGELGIPAFTFEVGYEFMPPYGEIDAVQWPANRPAFYYAASIARTPYKTIHGPDTHDISITGSDLYLTLSAVIDDTLNGEHRIAAAAFSIDDPHWVEGVEEVAMTAVDGEFDSSVEYVGATIDVSGLTPGQRHMVFIRGQDDMGNWGPVSAAYLEPIVPPANQLFIPVNLIP